MLQHDTQQGAPTLLALLLLALLAVSDSQSVFKPSIVQPSTVLQGCVFEAGAAASRTCTIFGPLPTGGTAAPLEHDTVFQGSTLGTLNASAVAAEDSRRAAVAALSVWDLSRARGAFPVSPAVVTTLRQLSLQSGVDTDAISSNSSDGTFLRLLPFPQSPDAHLVLEDVAVELPSCLSLGVLQAHVCSQLLPSPHFKVS